MTTNYIFPCGTVNGLTLNQKREAIAALRASIKNDRANRAADRIAAKTAKLAAATAKAEAATAKREAAIAKAQARLKKLMETPVGTKAVKAARKPGPVTVTKFQSETRAANDIAAALVAKRKTA